MLRSTILGSLGVLGLALSPALAGAQFMPAYVPPNPLYQLPPYQYQFNLGTTVPTTYGRAFVGVTVPFTRAPQIFSPNYGQPSSMYLWSPGGVPSSGYLSGGSYGSSGYSAGSVNSYSAQRDFEKAQRDAAKKWGGPDAAKEMISDQWTYEKIGLPGLANAGAGKPQPDALIKALSATSEADVASGEALNHLLAAIAAAEAKGGKGVSAFLPPQLLDTVRFAGGSGEVLNLVRQAGQLTFPAAFDSPGLRNLRDVLEKDFAAVAAPLLIGKPLDPMKVMKLEFTLKKLEEAASPVIRDQSFEDAIAARRFLNQFTSAMRALKGPNIVGLVNPAWTTDGTSVADLVKHMTKFKLQFGPAPQGSEPAYLALHSGLVTYLFVLAQPKK